MLFAPNLDGKITQLIVGIPISPRLEQLNSDDFVSFIGGSSAFHLIKEGLLERLNCILLGDPSIEVQKYVLLNMKTLFGNKMVKKFLIDLQSNTILQDICCRLFLFTKKQIQIKNHTLLENDENDLTKLAVLVLSLILLNNLPGGEINHSIEIHGCDMIQRLLGDSEFKFLGCLLAFSMIIKEPFKTSAMEDEIDVESGNMYQEQCETKKFGTQICIGSVFCVEFWMDLLSSSVLLLSDDNIYGKAIAIACISCSVYVDFSSSESWDEFSNLRENAIHTTLVVIQNALIDPVWTLNLRVLALTSLETILINSSRNQSSSIVSLEWFNFLSKQAFLSFRTVNRNCKDQATIWFQWAILLDVLCPYLTRQGQHVLFNRENLDDLQKATFQSKANEHLLMTFISIWISILAAKICKVDAEYIRELKNFLMTVFSDFSGQECGIVCRLPDIAFNPIIDPDEISENQAIDNYDNDTIIFFSVQALCLQKLGGEKTVCGRIVEVMRLLGDQKHNAI